ncbi:high affinity immunoglobulin epsilon receptor subunit alpha isoform X2 [Myotis yumanensis]|uniref:high affinity immunoglobulin epsilon receptor subunit alpha isoform X2 n=1 Tax=Myotis yumanensis TaxID=159337 RepID=UPI0038D382C7
MSTSMGGPALLWVALLLFSPDGMPADWLLLQSSSEVILEGESFLIRCHGWRDRNVFKVIYYKNGQALKYWYVNHNLSITNATLDDSGNYYCTGKIWQMNYTSESLKITIRKGDYYWKPLLIPVLVVILFAVDTGLFISTQQQFTFLLKIRSTRKGNKSMDPQPKPTPPKK